MGQRSTARAAGHPPWWLVAPAVLAALVALLPLGYLVARAGSLDAVGDVLATASTARLVARSLLLTGLVTCLATALGVATAWLVARTDLRGRRGWLIALVLPLAVPSYIGAFVWVQAVPVLAGLPGAVLVLTLATYPFVLLPVVAALQRVDPALEEVAASLGRGRAAVAWQVTLRQVRPSILAGALLVALYVLSDFGAVAILRYEVFTWAIFGAYRSGYDPTRAAVLALLLVALAVALVAWEARARGRASARIGSGVARTGRVVALGRLRAPAVLGLAGIVAAGIGMPAVTLLRWVLTGTADGRDAGEFGAALAASVWLSVLAAIACVLLAVPVGVLAARWPGRGVALVERSTFVGHALPGIVVAIAMVFVGVRLLRPVYQEVPLLVLGYVVLFLPLAVGAVRAAVESSALRGEEVARSLGLTPAAVLRRVTLPVAAPGMAAGAVLVALTTMKELPVTLLLHPTGTQTLATRLWDHMLVSDQAAAAPYAALIVLGAALPAVLLGRMGQLGGGQAVRPAAVSRAQAAVPSRRAVPAAEVVAR